MCVHAKERQDMAERKLSVKMFGGFAASYGDEILFFGKQRDSRFGQLFQILMTRPGQGFDKKKIAGSLYGRDEVEDSNASLNNTIFRLRNYLRTSPLPPGEHLVLNSGVLSFGKTVEVESDVWDFECLAKQFEEERDRRKKADICWKACGLYRGEFLPQLLNEQWVIEKNEYYQRLYSRMMEYLLRYLKEEADYGNMEKAAASAARIRPDEGWELWWVDSLISLGSYQKAEQVYREMSERMQENGSFLTEEMQARFQKMGARIRRPEGAGEDIGKYLAESGIQEGAYACMLPAFSDCLHVLKRIFSRGG